MRCRHCDTEIADKALICYRCGRATTAPRVASRRVRSRRGRLVALWLPVVALLVAAIYYVLAFL